MKKFLLRKSKAQVIATEARTLEALIGLYCRKQHGTKASLCAECEALRDYAVGRLQRCIFLPSKPTCARCPIHCYSPARREDIRRVMRYSAPRFYLVRPYQTLKHLWDTVKRPSEKVLEVSRQVKKTDDRPAA